MGEGGTLLLVNATPYDWYVASAPENKMNSWPFEGSAVPAGASVPFYIEWNESIFHHADADVASVTLALTGTTYSFQIQAKYRYLQVWLGCIETAGNEQGSVISLGWDHDGVMPFFLSGTEGAFSSNNPPTAWMQSNLALLGSRPLRHICIPGSHDAGMSVLRTHTHFVTHNDTITQVHTIGGQLMLGSRYFDCRPVINEGEYVSGHYADVKDVGWLGGTGQTFADIIREINEFTASNPELIILNLSHDLYTDGTNRSFTQVEWDGLLQQLMGLQNLFVVQDPTSVDLTTVPLAQFIGGGQASVVVIAEPDDNENVSLGEYAYRGVYRYAQLNAYNSYSDTRELTKMIDDQLQKMREVRRSPDSQYFLLSWTLTQDALEVVGVGENILKLARTALPKLYTDVFPACSASTYPNILYIDRFHTSDVTALAMAINSITEF